MPKGQSKAAVDSYSNGKWNVNYLKFLVDFMEETGLSTASAAEKVGLTRVSVYYWLKKDDVKLSMVYKLIEACGYNIFFSLEKTRNNGTADVNIEVKRERGDKRLWFLDDGLRRYKVNRLDLLRKLSLSPSTLAYWLQVDDIYISYVYKIAEICGLVLKIDIRPK